MIEFLDELETFGSMARGTIGRHRFSMRIFMASLAIGIFVRGRHIAEDFVHMARRASHCAVLSGEVKFCILIMVEFDPRKARRHMAE